MPRYFLTCAGAGGPPRRLRGSGQSNRAVKARVKAGSGTLSSIVKLTTYLVDIRHRNELAQIREEFFGKKAPASTLVGVAALALPGWLIEVEAIAVL